MTSRVQPAAVARRACGAAVAMLAVLLGGAAPAAAQTGTVFGAAHDAERPLLRAMRGGENCDVLDGFGWAAGRRVVMVRCPTIGGDAFSLDYGAGPVPAAVETPDVPRLTDGAVPLATTTTLLTPSAVGDAPTDGAPATPAETAAVSARAGVAALLRERSLAFVSTPEDDGDRTLAEVDVGMLRALGQPAIFRLGTGSVAGCILETPVEALGSTDTPTALAFPDCRLEAVRAEGPLEALLGAGGDCGPTDAAGVMLCVVSMTDSGEPAVFLGPTLGRAVLEGPSDGASWAVRLGSVTPRLSLSQWPADRLGPVSGAGCQEVRMVPRFLGYCASADRCETAAGGPVDAPDGQFALPSPAEAGWSGEDFPSGVALTLAAEGAPVVEVPAYVSLMEGDPSAAADANLDALLDQLNVTQPLRIDFAEGMTRPARWGRLRFYEDAACGAPAPGAPDIAYDRGSQNIGTPVDACLFARVEEGTGDDRKFLSRCAALVSENGQAVVRAPALSFGEKRRMLLIAQASSLQTVSGPLRDAVAALIDKIRAAPVGAPPVTIAIVNEARISEIARAEDIVEAANAASLDARVQRTLSFLGDAQQPLRDLNDLEQRYLNRLDRILYVIDGSLPPGEDIRFGEIGAALGWAAQGVPLAVLTTDETDCPAGWEGKLQAERCQAIGAASAVAEELERFLLK